MLVVGTVNAVAKIDTAKNTLAETDTAANIAFEFLCVIIAAVTAEARIITLASRAKTEEVGNTK